MYPAIKRAAPERVAHLTFLAGSRDYCAVKLAYPLVVAVLPNVPEAHRRALLNQGCVVREV
jgi:hypothetical protein